jgi:hypothetical protein
VDKEVAYLPQKAVAPLFNISQKYPEAKKITNG